MIPTFLFVVLLRPNGVDIATISLVRRTCSHHVNCKSKSQRKDSSRDHNTVVRHRRMFHRRCRGWNRPSETCGGEPGGRLDSDRGGHGDCRGRGRSGGGGAGGLAGMGVTLMGVGFLLGNAIDNTPLATLIVGLAALVLAYLLYRNGSNKMSTTDLPPDRTQRTLQRTPDAVRGNLNTEKTR